MPRWPGARFSRTLPFQLLYSLGEVKILSKCPETRAKTTGGCPVHNKSGVTFPLPRHLGCLQ